MIKIAMFIGPNDKYVKISQHDNGIFYIVFTARYLWEVIKHRGTLNMMEDSLRAEIRASESAYGYFDVKAEKGIKAVVRDAMRG